MTASAVDIDVAKIREWFNRLSSCVQAVDFEAARDLFAEDMVAFGTFSDFVVGRAAVEEQQWRKVWPHIRNFHWDFENMKAMVSSDRLFGLGLACFVSIGFTQEGVRFDRPGRATVAFRRRSLDDNWVACHTHMSLFRGVPQQSFG